MYNQLYKLYSQRKKEELGEPEVFVYDVFPVAFRNQYYRVISKIITVVSKDIYCRTDLEGDICDYFSELKGLKIFRSLEHYIDHCNDLDFLDLVDFIFAFVLNNENFFNPLSVDKEIFSAAVNDINHYFKQNSLGYEFTNGSLLVKTNTIAHENIIKPTLKLLVDEKFRGSEEEYLTAFENFKNGENENAVTNAMKSFESCMKIICTELQFEFNPNNDTASKLIKILEINNFFPSYLSSHMNGIKQTLESGAPALRNRNGGHGQGAEVRVVTDDYVEYTLNLVASNMIFLYKLYKEKSNELNG